MEVNIAQLMKSGIGAERQYKIDEEISVGDKEVPVRGEIKLIRTDRGILAKGTLQAAIDVDCSRCLQPYSCPLKVSFEDEYFPTIDIVTGLPALIPEEELPAFTIDVHHIINLDEPIRQYLLLALPMKPLCKADCAGICPGCGNDLNLGSCDCPPPETDNSWAQLKQLLEKK